MQIISEKELKANLLRGYSFKILQLKLICKTLKIEQMYFEDIIQENLLQYISP